MDSGFFLLVIFFLFAGTDSFVISPVPTRNTREGGLPICLERSYDEAYPGATIIPFYFTIESSIEPGARLINELKGFLQYILHAAIYWCPDEDNNTGELGATTPSNQTRLFRDFRNEESKQFGIVEIMTDSIDALSDCK
jgi:hypothetical protein